MSSTTRHLSHPSRLRVPPRLVAVILACLVAALFWVPSFAVGRGYFPTPLDDVYIHFDFARSLGQGHPFEWISGQGYSSGETSPLYALILAIGWIVGFRGRLLGVWAAIVAILCVASLLSSVRRLIPSSCASWLAWLIALLPLSLGIVDWALFSGMEVAAFAAAMGLSLEALAALSQTARGGPTREAREWKVGAWGAALVLLRPEAVVIVSVFAVLAARAAGRRSALRVLVRTSLFGVLATGAVLALNRLATGDARSAGAQLKLLSSNPYMSDVDRARVFVENLITFWLKVIRSELSISPSLAIVLPVLAVTALLRREHRAIASACIFSAVGWILLVSWNGNAPYHNFRYYAPCLVLLTIAAALGLATIASIARRFYRRGTSSAITGVLAMLAIGIAAPKVPAQARHFRTASANIRDQHVEVGERIARLPKGSVVLLGDAGAIPYVSESAAVDALGLGGYRHIPFAHAAVFGEAATIELIERLDPSERPTHFALYPNWFAGLTSTFGVEIDRVTIENNIICGSPTKAIYRADWSALEDPRMRRPSLPTTTTTTNVVDEIDVGDVIDEEDHSYVPPLPHGGYTSLDVLLNEAGAKRFDGGRTIPDGERESFVVKKSAAGPLTLRVRVDANAQKIVLHSSRSLDKELDLEPPHQGSWRSASISLDAIEVGDVISLEARGGTYRDFHVWIVRSETVTR